MRALFEIIGALIDIAMTKGTDAARSLALMRKPQFDATRGEVYLRALRRLAVAAALLPVLFVPLGLWGGVSKVLVPLTALLWTVVVLAFALAASPLGILIDALRGGPEGIGERYVRFVGNVLFIGYACAFLVATIPLSNNLAGVPLLLLVSLILGLGGLFTKRWVVKMALAALPLILLSFFSPNVFGAFERLKGRLEGRAVQVIDTVATDSRVDAVPGVSSAAARQPAGAVARPAPRAPRQVTIATVRLRGWNRPTEWVDLTPALSYPGWYAHFEGPGQRQFRDDIWVANDGEFRPFKRAIRFRGPVGKETKVLLAEGG